MLWFASMLSNKVSCLRESGPQLIATTALRGTLVTPMPCSEPRVPWSLTLTTAVGAAVHSAMEHGSEASSCPTARSAIGHRYKILPIQKISKDFSTAQPKCGRKLRNWENVKIERPLRGTKARMSRWERLGLFQQRPFVRDPVSAPPAGFGKLVAGLQGSAP